MWTNALEDDLEGRLVLKDLLPWVERFDGLFKHLNLFFAATGTRSELRKWREVNGSSEETTTLCDHYLRSYGGATPKKLSCIELQDGTMH